MLRGQRLYFQKKYCEFFSLKTDFVSANREDPDEMPHFTAFHLGLNCLAKYSFRVFLSTKGYVIHSSYKSLIYQGFTRHPR